MTPGADTSVFSRSGHECRSARRLVLVNRRDDHAGVDSIGSSDPDVRWHSVPGSCVMLACGEWQRPTNRRKQPLTTDQAAKDQAAGKTPPTSPASPAAAAKADDRPGFFAQPGDDPSLPFVPLRPSTVDDRRRLEAVRLYSAARALEDQRDWSDAVALLQEALKLDPDSIAITRRLCRLYVGALGRPELALQYGKRVLAIDPGDTNTLAQLVDYYKKNDPAGAEGLLNEVLANPKLDRARAGPTARRV